VVLLRPETGAVAFLVSENSQEEARLAYELTRPDLDRRLIAAVDRLRETLVRRSRSFMSADITPFGADKS
jgi:hypothetical protein